MKTFYQTIVARFRKNVAQSVTLLCRRLAIGGGSNFSSGETVSGARRMAFCDTAGWQPALRVFAFALGLTGMLAGASAPAQSNVNPANITDGVGVIIPNDG